VVYLLSPLPRAHTVLALTHAQELSDTELIDHPHVYRAKTRNRTLSFREFLIWTLTGCYQGVIVYYGTYVLLGSVRENVSKRCESMRM
jgi:hypothetical protein